MTTGARKFIFRRPICIFLLIIVILYVFTIPTYLSRKPLDGQVVELGTPSDNPVVGNDKSLPDHFSKTFPPLDPSSRNYHEWNARMLIELITCMGLENCGPNQTKVALLAAHWFEEAVVRGWNGGEGVWAASVYKHLKAMGYTTFFANSFEEALGQYRLFPDLVKVVIRNKAGECHSDPKCVKGPTNPTGIPAWKIFDFEYYPSPHATHYHPSLLRGKWILSANPDPNPQSPIQHIGFSIEEACQRIPTVRLAERSHRVWMLMKQLTYVYDKKFAWNRSYFALASTAEPSLNHIQFVGAWEVDQTYQWKPKEMGIMQDIEDTSKGVVNIRKKELSPAEFSAEVAKSKVMLGMGNPWWSPSPYYALCFGVPFINPVFHWDEHDPWNKEKWQSQHTTLQAFDPPYVYHVHAHNYSGFVDAILTASTTEVPSFIPSFLTEASVRDRVRSLMETDWKKEAAVLLEERLKEKKQGGSPYIFEL